MFQPTKEWVNKVNLSSFELENFFKFGACVISARKAKQLDATTMFTYSHANTPLGQSERAYYLSYFIIYSSLFEQELQSNQVKRTPQDSISELIIWKMNPLVVPVTGVKFKAAFLHA